MGRKTDCQWLLEVLRDGKPHSLNEILQKSFADRGHGLTVHSRAADLRKQGHTVEWRHHAGEARGWGSVYRLVTPTEEEVVAA